MEDVRQARIWKQPIGSSPYPNGLPGYHRDDPQTSIEAAETVAKTLSEKQQRVLDFLVERGEFGTTDDEGEQSLDMYSFRRRRSELVKMGYAEASGRTRMSARKTKMTVWVATP